MVRHPVVIGFKPCVSELALTKAASAVLSHGFAHSHELSGAVLGEEPDNILVRVSDKRPYETIGFD